jgi:succinyl-diaminopimelate desuccinylase
MTQTADAIGAFVREQTGAQTAFLAELVRIPSDNPPGDCTPAALKAAELIEKLGLVVERHEVPESLVKKVGMISATNLIVRQRFGDGITVALNAHGDVVPPGTGWTHDPYGAEVVDGWMYGRGAAVSKSDFATYLFALMALKASSAALKGSVEVHLTYDEESGGEIGPGLLLEQGISKPDLALGAGFSYGVVNAHNGCLHLEVEVTGRSAHAAKPYTGIDALEAANHVLTALYESRKSLAEQVSTFPGIGSPQLTIGLIEGGINTNVVPDRVVFRLDRRMIPDENAGIAEDMLRAVITTAAADFPDAKVAIRRILLAEPLTPLPGAGKLTELLCTHASRIMGEAITAGGVPLYTDARHYAAHGVPIVLYGAGPHSIEEANAHRADERLFLADLPKATEVVALTLLDLLSA